MKRSHNFGRLLSATVLAGSISVGLIPAAVQAQDQGASSASTAEDSEVVGLDDIIVTAQKQSQSLQKAAVAVSVVGSDELRLAGVADVSALTAMAPSFTSTPVGGGGVNFFLRGVGNFTSNPLYDAAIAFNYDNVYVGRPAGTSTFFYDLERIEVLKGPQGTLYGRNATGGAINVIPTKPAIGENSGYVTATLGNYDTRTLEGAVNIAMGANGALRVSGNLSKHDGYMSDGTQDDDTHALRVQLAAELTPGLKIRMAADYAHQGGGASSGSYFSVFPYNPVTGQYTEILTGLSPKLGGHDPVSQAFRQTIFALPGGRTLGPVTPKPYVNNDSFGANAEIEWDTGAGLLTVIPAWRYFRQDNILAPGGFDAQRDDKNEQFSLEARFDGDRIGIFDYQIGGLYFSETNKGRLSASQQMLVNAQRYDQRVDSYAVFGRLTANLSERFRLVGGARFTRDNKSLNASSDLMVLTCTAVAPPFCPNAPLIPAALEINDLLAQGYAVPPPAAGPGPSVIPTFFGGIPTGALLVRQPLLVVNNSVKSNKVTWRAAVEFDIADQSLLFASVETGFRAGGLQPVDGVPIYDPETITAYTFGSKNRFFDNRLQINLEAFYWKYDNQQLAAIQTDSGGRQGFFIRNIGRATLYGLSADIMAKATPTTTLTGQVEYLHTNYDRFNYQVPAVGPGGAVPPPFTTCPFTAAGGEYQVNCSGFPAYNAPKWTVNLAVEQKIPVGAEYEFTLNATTQYRSSRWIGFDFQPAQLVGSTWQSNAQITFGRQDGGWSLSAYARNIENDRFPVSSNASAIGGLTTVLFNPPRTYGLRLSAEF